MVTADEVSADDLITTYDLARKWVIPRSAAGQRAKRIADRLGIEPLRAVSPSGQSLTAYRKVDGDRLIREHAEQEARRARYAAAKEEKKEQIEWEVGTGQRSDVMTVYDIAARLDINRDQVSKIARRAEEELGIQRVKARSRASRQRVIAYMKSDGEKIIKFRRESERKRAADQKRREARERKRAAIPKAPPPKAEGVLYLIDLEGGGERFKLGWSQNPTERARGFRTANPQLKIVKTWTCPQTREGDARAEVYQLDCVYDKARETFRTDDTARVITVLDSFLAH